VEALLANGTTTAMFVCNQSPGQHAAARGRLR